MSVATHCRGEHEELQGPIMRTLCEETDPEILVFALGAFQKHVVEFHRNRGSKSPKRPVRPWPSRSDTAIPRYSVGS